VRVCVIFLYVNGFVWRVTVVEAKDVYCGSHCRPSPTFSTHVKVSVITSPCLIACWRVDDEQTQQWMSSSHRPILRGN